MDLTEALDRVSGCVTQQDLADRLGVDVQRVRQARLAPGTAGRRPAPAGWQRALADLVRERGRDFAALADELDPPTR